MSTPRNVVWCPRSRHRLAWLEAEPDGTLIVGAAAVSPGRQRLTSGHLRVRAADLEDTAGETVMVGCACKKRWSLDLVLVLRGVEQQLHRITGDEFPGVSFDR